MPDAAERTSTLPQDETEIGFKTFLNISEEWGLTSEQQIVLLGSPARSTFFKWKKDGGTLPYDTVERISHTFAAYKCLEILFTDHAQSAAWIRKSNRYFAGQSALEHMLGGRVSDIIDVRRYLDAQRGG